MRSSRRPRVALVALAVTLVPALVPVVGASAAAGCSGVTRSGSWTVARAPGGSVVHATVASRPTTSYVSDGVRIARTTDGGCTWREVWRVPAARSAEQPYDAATAQVVALAVPPAPKAAARVLAVVQDGVDGSETSTGATLEGRLHVVRSEDGGATWTSGDSGLVTTSRNVRREQIDAAGSGRCGDVRGCVLRIAPSDPDVVYLATETTPLLPGRLHRSADGGRTWVPRASLVQPSGAGVPGGLGSLAVDPVAPDVLWAEVDGRLAQSRDGGTTWRAVHVASVYGDLLTLQSSSGRPTRVLHLLQDPQGRPWAVAARALRSDDGGAGFRPANVSGLHGQRTDSIASGPRPDDLVALTASGRGTLLGFSPRSGRWVDLDPQGLVARTRATSDVQAVRGGFTVLGPAHLLTYRGPVGVDIPLRTTAVAPRR